MKKIFLLLSFVFLMPSTVLAEETINNGDTITPIGTISVYAGIESDSQLEDRGYLVANGASLSKEEYSELYAIIGTTYGSTDSNHFNLPDLRGRTAVGVDADDADFNTLGKKGGEKTVTLTVDQIPAHTHTFTGTASTTSAESNSHTHTYSGTTSTKTLNGRFHTWGMTTSAVAGIFTTVETNLNYSPPDSGDLTGAATYYIDASHNHTFSGTTSGASTTHTHTFKPTGTNAETGGSKAHNNLQPYIALKYIIKFKNVTSK